MRIPKFIPPLLVLLTLLGGYFLRYAFTQPTTAVSFEGPGRAMLACTVQGMHCKGKAYFFTQLYKGIDGISSIETFASEQKAVFTYDPSAISPEAIRATMERPIPLRDGSTRQVFKCLSMDPS